MSYIYVINETDDPKTSVALYRKSDGVLDINVHAWMTAYIPIGSKARLNIGESYGIFISYYSPGGNILYESEVMNITDGEGVFRVIKSGQEITLIQISSSSIDNDILVEIDKKVARLVNVNIIRNKQVYFSFPTSPGNTQQFALQEELFISKVRPEVTQGSVLEAREILIPPDVIQPGQTAILTGTANLGYDFIIRNEVYSDFISL
jgi:hypothetical protein